MRVVVEFGAVDVLRRHDAFESGHDDFAGRRRHHVERELVAIDAALEEFDERRQTLLEAYALAGFDEMFAAHAAELRIVADEIGELAALLHEMAGREAGDLLLEVGDSEQLAQLESRVVEAQRLIEIRREEKMFRRSRFHKLLQSMPLVRAIACPS